VAVVEDDEDIRGNVCRFLEKSGLHAWPAGSAEEFYVQLLRERADLVLVDLGLPGEDGLSLVQRLAEQEIPVVVLTARGEVDSRISGLEAGALQYFVKPVDLHELVAGIRSLLRRSGTRNTVASDVATWRLDVARASLVAPNQQSIALTSREFDLMRCLMEAHGALVTKQGLLDAMGYGGAVDAFHRIETLLVRLRRKCLEGTGHALPVRTVFARGLVFVA